MKSLVTCCFLFVLFLGQSVSATDYCPPMKKAEKEGDPWYIPESAFTRAEANKALGALRSQVNKDWAGADWPNVENHLKMIKGYRFRVYLDGYKKEFGEDDKILREEFCRFIRDEAFVSH
jgi:hypothetical protein